jgi:hypothetical protein
MRPIDLGAWSEKSSAPNVAGQDHGQYWQVSSVQIDPFLPKATEPPGMSTKGSLPGEQISSSHIPPSATNFNSLCPWQLTAGLVGAIGLANLRQ